jgi:hypothetical protein
MPPVGGALNRVLPDNTNEVIGKASRDGIYGRGCIRAELVSMASSLDCETKRCSDNCLHCSY